MRADSHFGRVSAKTLAYTFALRRFTLRNLAHFSIARPIFQVFSYPRLIFWPTFYPLRVKRWPTCQSWHQEQSLCASGLFPGETSNSFTVPLGLSPLPIAVWASCPFLHLPLLITVFYMCFVIALELPYCSFCWWNQGFRDSSMSVVEQELQPKSCNSSSSVPPDESMLFVLG